jgi:hypothetical protein
MIIYFFLIRTPATTRQTGSGTEHLSKNRKRILPLPKGTPPPTHDRVLFKHRQRHGQPLNPIITQIKVGTAHIYHYVQYFISNCYLLNKKLKID